MSAGLESLLDPERRAQCEANDALLACCTHRCYEGRHCPNRHGFPTARRYPRTAGEAFRDASYSDPWEPHIQLPMWKRVALFLRRRFS